MASRVLFVVDRGGRGLAVAIFTDRCKRADIAIIRRGCQGVANGADRTDVFIDLRGRDFIAVFVDCNGADRISRTDCDLPVSVYFCQNGR